MVSDLTGELIDSRYLLQRIVASGGMATIYAGIDTRLDRPVAVKIMHAHLANDEAFVSRFIKEAKATAALSHQILSLFKIRDGMRVGHLRYFL